MESKSINLCRGKRKSDGKWVEGNYLHLNVGRDFICDGTVWIGTLTPCKEEVKPETVGQYTGLTDKNGKKIFEGDIIAHHAQGDIIVNRGAVVWDARDGRWVYQLHTMQPGFYMHNPETVEIIGNIHDNPEILEGRYGE